MKWDIKEILENIGTVNQNNIKSMNTGVDRTLHPIWARIAMRQVCLSSVLFPPMLGPDKSNNYTEMRYIGWDGVRWDKIGWDGMRLDR